MKPAYNKKVFDYIKKLAEENFIFVIFGRKKKLLYEFIVKYKNKSLHIYWLSYYQNFQQN